MGDMLLRMLSALMMVVAAWSALMITGAVLLTTVGVVITVLS